MKKTLEYILRAGGALFAENEKLPSGKVKDIPVEHNNKQVRGNAKSAAEIKGKSSIPQEEVFELLRRYRGENLIFSCSFCCSIFFSHFSFVYLSIPSFAVYNTFANSQSFLLSHFFPLLQKPVYLAELDFSLQSFES